MKLRIGTAIAAMDIIKQGGPDFSLNALGISPEDWELATGDNAWLGKERPRVMRVLDGFLYGVIDNMGLPRFELPAEYAAAIIAVFVSAKNYFPAVSWVSNLVSNQELATNAPREGWEDIKPRQLFALVLEVHEKADRVAEAYCNKTGSAISRLTVSSNLVANKKK